MVDLAQLEKMGRELKCPICWSLFKSAASLSCNHIFCNACIVESMKSMSDCPVCKVPFRRREIRAAPHMDNLVSIYKSMEVATGTNIFSTQMGPPTQVAGDSSRKDRLVPSKDEKNHMTTVREGVCQKKSMKKGPSKMRKGKEITNAKHSPRLLPIKPSFPAKKRVHVTPYPVSMAPMRPGKISKLEDPGNELKPDVQVNNNEELAPDSVEDPLFSPFFWLRDDGDDDDEEDDGDVGGETPRKPSGQQITETPSPYSPPCFSDIKDSDDEKPSSSTPVNKSNAVEYFDSEMFAWTQRACSPELCSTPQRTQTTKARHSLQQIPEIRCQENTDGMVKPCSIGPREDNKVGPVGQSGRINRKKRKCKSNSLPVKRKSSIKRIRHVLSDDVNEEIAASSGELVERTSPKRGRRIIKRCNSVSHNQSTFPMISKNQNAIAVPVASEQPPDVSVKAKVPILKENIVTDRSNGKMKATNTKRQRKHVTISNNVQAKLSKVVEDSCTEEEVQNQISPIKSADMTDSTYQQSECGKCSDGIVHKRGKVIDKQQLVELRVHGVEDQGADLIEGKRVKASAALINSTACENNETSVSTVKESKVLAVTNKATNAAQNSENIVLVKCKKNHSLIQCAFCHSSNDTKDSGEMMHYFNGKPVAVDFNGGVDVIHSHKHCTEWAPDVYFEDDIAVNLFVEVSRSRRIKCSCCGVKGAALGCYEKSCRKSFHYTCAKLMPECKWDTQNFVMLCPLHLSTKLPNEASESHRQNRKRSAPKGSPQASSASKSYDHPRNMWSWPSGSPCKWVLCCSALSADEKEAVIEFSKLTGVPVLNTWNPEVTHVIASTDCNGAYKRTLKILKGILDGKWILRVDWIKACMESMEPVGEQKFEVTVDVYGISGGPQLGRLRATNKQPKLFNGLRFYFSGDYTASYKGYLQDLVLAAGGVVLQRKPISRDHERLLGDTSTRNTFIIFSNENSEKPKGIIDVVINRRSEAQALADASGGTSAASTWIIDSIAACKLQPLT
ncbi:hypothetical protein Cni_G00407 [Canna indica]|uniref:Protein BREAST CANCER SUSCEPTIBILITY 1 homolog n=1 Tax=Canna indica TaxID=4628 RepID=A0AAQ3JKU5_9LILI|nr:hypothetical protein Cni_G00407 [Canna indica]